MNSNTVTSWSSIVTKKEDVIVKKVSLENEAIKLQQEADAKAALLEEKERKRQGYIRAMERKYGLKQDFYLYSSTISDPIAKKGDFWCFIVEMSPDDGPIAKKLRSDKELQEIFINYLTLKYGLYDWLTRSKNSEEDCKFLYDIRNKKEREYKKMRDEHEKAREVLRIESKKEFRKEKQEMKDKVKSGEITRKEYQDWKWQIECDEDYAWESIGVSIWWK
jgi:di/tripeptidase